MIKKGLLDKRGKPNENTPGDWKKSYVDYSIKTEPAEAKAAEPSAAKEEKKRKREEKSGSSSDSDAEAKSEKKKKKKKSKQVPILRLSHFGRKVFRIIES
jgi:H/ACA ribonucleoprotein complex subunit 4